MTDQAVPSDMKAVHLILSGLLLFLVNGSVAAQAGKTDPLTFQLGNTVITIPAPRGFEEAASQFERIRDNFTQTEDPGNDMLAVHVPRGDCERLRRGEFGPLNFYTKISVLKVIRGVDYSADRFALLVTHFRKNGSQVLDMNSPRMKATVAHLNAGLSKLNKEQTQVELSQPVNLGEFDTRPNIYSVMLFLTFKTQTSEGERVVPIVAGLSYVRVKQRMIYVYTYRRYESTTDVETLRDFTKQWIGQILAAN